jgi:hypothetical protein
MLVDTNVALVANRAHPQASLACVEACMSALQGFHDGDSRLVLDFGGDILAEYIAQGYGFPQKAGDLFFIWAITNRANPAHCIEVKITVHPDRRYVEFPDDEELAHFDRNDRKFVAAAIAHGGMPPILNAVDSHWRESAEPLSKYVDVTQLCRK